MTVRSLKRWPTFLAIALIALLAPFVASTARADHTPQEPYISQPVLYTDDMRAMVTFYRTIGFKVINYEPREGDPFWVSMYVTGETGVVNRLSLADYDALRQFNPELKNVRKAVPRQFSVARVVYHDEDVDKYVDAVRDAGYTVVREPADREWNERDAYVLDPEGNYVQITTHLDIFPPCPDDCPIYQD
jgi:Uncharacterized protein conserved in bacteria